jgi:hypothetical protein
MVIDNKIIELSKSFGFDPKTVTTKYTYKYYLGSKEMPFINNTCKYLLLCEIQKWLITQYSLFINVEPFENTEGSTSFGATIIWKNMEDEDEHPHDNFFSEYEESLRDAILESLLLIEKFKSKENGKITELS